MQKKFIYPIILFVIVGCSNLFPNYDFVGVFIGSGPDVDVRFENSMQYAESHAPFSMLVDDNYCVYVGGDSHVDSTSRNLEQFMLSYRADSTAVFALHVGDFVNAQGNYERFYKATQVLPDGYIRKTYDTLLVTCGNHDILFGQWKEYLKYYKTSSYWFETVSRTTGAPLDLFISIDTSSGTVGRKQLDWLRGLLAEKSQEKYRHIIIFTHTNFFKQDSSQGLSTNFSLEETTELTGLFTRYGVTMVWNGHDHSREVTTYGSVTYITLDAMKDPAQPACYMVARMGDSVTYDFVKL